MRESDHAFVPVGEGNVVSIEFNLLYRWHSTLSAQDTVWTTKMLEGISKDPSEVKKTVTFSLAVRTYRAG
jgi:linoleate 10R-lipoxygenase